jgi:hypothetical protein
MITVYWACTEHEWQRAQPPVNISKNHFQKECYRNTGMEWCPAFKEALTNVYGIRSIYSYELTIDEFNRVNVDPHPRLEHYPSDEGFFQNHFIGRNLENKVFSFTQNFLYLCDEDLEMTGNLAPYLEENEVANRCIPTPGRFNIGQWQRTVEFACKLRDKYDTFKIEENDIFTYTQFHTKEKIQFKQFIATRALMDLIEDNMQMRNNKARVWPMGMYKSKVKKLIMKEAKRNLL